MGKILKSYLHITIVLVSLLGCTSSEYMVEDSDNRFPEIVVEAEDYITYDGIINLVVTSNKDSVISTKSKGWLAYDIELEIAGPYQVSVITTNKSAEVKAVWIEDYYNNKENKTYNITGDIQIPLDGGFLASYTTLGVSLKGGMHKMKFHFTEDLQIDKIVFKLMDNYDPMPVSFAPNRENEVPARAQEKQKMNADLL